MIYYIKVSFIILFPFVLFSQNKISPFSTIKVNDSLYIDRTPITTADYHEFIEWIGKYSFSKLIEKFNGVPRYNSKINKFLDSLIYLTNEDIKFFYQNKYIDYDSSYSIREFQDSLGKTYVGIDSSKRYQHDKVIFYSNNVYDEHCMDYDTTDFEKKHFVYPSRYYKTFFTPYCNLPAILLTQNTAKNYCKWRSYIVNLIYSENSKKNRKKYFSHVEYRLPTEAEMNYAINSLESISSINVFYQPKVTHTVNRYSRKATFPVAKCDIKKIYSDKYFLPENENTLLIPSNNIAEWLNEPNKIFGVSWNDDDCNMPYNTVRTLSTKLDKDGYSQNLAEDWIGFRCVCVVKEE